MVPEGWVTKKIKDVLDRVVDPVDVNSDASYEQIGIRSHGKGIFYKEPVLGKQLGNKRVYWVKPDCFVVNIVFAWEQAIARTTSIDIGKIASHRFPMYQSSSGEADIDYLTYYFKSPRGKYLLGLASPGGAGRNKTLGQKEFGELDFSMPPGSEQKKIARILSTWDKSIETVGALIENSKAYKKALIQQLLTGKLLLPGFEGDWNTYEFSTVASLSKAKFNPKNSNKSVTCIELEHISQGTGRLVGSIDSHGQSSVKSIFAPGDVLFGKLRPYLRKYWLSNIDGVCSTEIWVLRARKNICLPEYLFYLVQSERFVESCHVTSGSKMPRADWGYVAKSPFEIPSLEEQRKIARYLRKADEVISCLEGISERLRKEKFALMQQLLTGRRRVKVGVLPECCVAAGV